MASSSSADGRPSGGLSAAHSDYAEQSAQIQTVQALHQHNAHLQAQLAKSVHLAQDLQHQNTALQAAFTRVKAEAEEMREAYQLVRAQAESALQAKGAAESECEKLYGVWQEKLVQKQSEFELIQQSMVPARELDLIRLQIMQEAATQHAQFADELKGEVGKYRQLYHETHHSLVLLTNDANLKTQAYEKDVAELRARSERTLGELGQKNRKLQELVQDTTLTEKAKALERANNELLVRNKALAQEVADVSKQVQGSHVAAEQAKLQATGAVADKDALQKQFAKESELASKAIADLQKDLAVALAQAQSLREEGLAFAKLADHQSSQAEIQLQDLAFQKSDLEKRLREAERKEEATAGKTRETIEGLHERNVTLERRVQDAQQKQEYDTREHAAQVKALKEEHACTVREVEHQLLLSQERVQSLQKDILELELRKNEELSTLKQKLLTLQSELAVLHSERETHDQRLAELQAEVDGTRAEMDGKVREHHELNLEYEQLQGRYRGLTEKEHALEAAYDKLALESDSIKNELQTATNGLEDARKQFLAELTQTKAHARNEKAILLARLEEVAQAAQAQSERLTRELVDLRREKAKYKKLSLGMKEKMGEILREYAQSKRDTTLASDAARFHQANLQREKEDAERQRDEYKLRMGQMWPHTMLSTTPSALAHTHQSFDVAVHQQVEVASGHAHASTTAAAAAGNIDAASGARAAQRQLAEARARAGM